MQVQILIVIYSELIKYTEAMCFAMEREEPVIQVIDEPRLIQSVVGWQRAVRSALLALFFLFGTIVSLLLKVFYLGRITWLIPSFSCRRQLLKISYKTRPNSKICEASNRDNKHMGVEVKVF